MALCSKTDRCQYHGRKDAGESGECEALLAADPELHNKQAYQRTFQNQLEYDDVGLITERIHQQKWLC